MAQIQINQFETLAKVIKRTAEIREQSFEQTEFGGRYGKALFEAAPEAAAEIVVVNTPEDEKTRELAGTMANLALFAFWNDALEWADRALGIEKPAPVEGEIVEDGLTNEQIETMLTLDEDKPEDK